MKDDAKDMKSSKISSGSSTCTDARISSKQHCGQSASSLTRQFRYTVQRPLTSPWKTCVFSSYFSPSFRFLLMLVYPWAWLPYPKSSETFLPWRMIDVRVEWWHSRELTCLDLMLILIFLFLKGEQQQQSLVDCFCSTDGCNCGG